MPGTPGMTERPGGLIGRLGQKGSKGNATGNPATKGRTRGIAKGSTIGSQVMSGRATGKPTVIGEMTGSVTGNLVTKGKMQGKQAMRGMQATGVSPTAVAVLVKIRNKGRGAKQADSVGMLSLVLLLETLHLLLLQ